MPETHTHTAVASKTHKGERIRLPSSNTRAGVFVLNAAVHSLSHTGAWGARWAEPAFAAEHEEHVLSQEERQLEAELGQELGQEQHMQQQGSLPLRADLLPPSSTTDAALNATLSSYGSRPLPPQSVASSIAQRGSRQETGFVELLSLLHFLVSSHVPQVTLTWDAADSCMHDGMQWIPMWTLGGAGSLMDEGMPKAQTWDAGDSCMEERMQKVLTCGMQWILEWMMRGCKRPSRGMQ
eukprot:1161694-Pelagomonas_calceolata.AAC.2